MQFLEPTNMDIRWIEYGSQFLIELHIKDTEECKSDTTNVDCYYVQVFYNYEQLKLKNCQELDCTFKEYERLLEQQFYNDYDIERHCQGTGKTTYINEAKEALFNFFK